MPDNPQNSFVLALTGGIGCGKSTAGSVFKQLGFEVCDTDLVAHDLMQKGTPVYADLVKVFGEGILSECGEIARPKLGAIVFNHSAERAKLNAVVHPAVRSFLVEWIHLKQAELKRAAVEIPLLFESGMDDLSWDAVLCVSSSDELVCRRLASRGIDEMNAEERIKAQLPLKEKEERSDYVVQNNGSLEQFETALRDVVQRMMVER